MFKSFTSFYKLFQSTHKIALVSIPFIMRHNDVQQCFFGWFSTNDNRKLDKNLIANRINTIQYPANNPIEDRFSVQQLTSIKGYAGAVYDGHGGWQMSDYANKRLLGVLDELLKKNKQLYPNEQELITKSLTEAFDQIQNQFLAMARQSYRLGFSLPGNVGSCALVVVVANNKIYTANSGDSQAIIVGEKNTFVKLNQLNNAASLVEQERLKKKFPNEEDIVVCKKPTSCYVKGRLQPTRALGDFKLKYPQFNNPLDYSKDHGFRTRIKVFTGPYITHVPEITVVQLKKSHKYVIIGCDGLWDELSNQDVATIVNNNLKNKKKIQQALLNAALAKAAHNANRSVQQLKAIPLGQRRKLHDDISIVGIDLQNQIE